MPQPFDRRTFLRSSLLFGAGLGLILPHVAYMQAETPEGTPESTLPAHLELMGSIRQVHDPSIIKAADAYYVFCTGDGIFVRKSLDLINWTIPFPASAFPHTPDWASAIIPNAPGIWAPDISFHNGKYYLYYAVSTFGKNTSVIGLATNTTLDSKAEGFHWEDQGLVLQSTAADNYNCIDPNLVIDADGGAWLAFGSFWSGIKMRRLDPDTGKPSADDPMLYALAERFVNSKSIEAPFIVRRENYYYLFASFDFCCRGANSDYHVMVGRSESVTGPYADRDGVPMLQGGGTQVTFPTDQWRGPGHNGILIDNGVYYIAYHAYDATLSGVPTLRIDPLVWDADGWPSITPPA